MWNETPQLYQAILGAVTEENTTIHRLGVSWPTGAGKTYGIIMVLNNWFYQPKGKVVIFPSNSIVKEFLGDLLKFDGPWKKFILSQTSNLTNFTEVQRIISLTGQLSKAGSNGFPFGPLRIFSYGQAGGSTAFGQSQNAVFKFNKKQRTSNPYDGVQVIMDEVHNLTRPSTDLKNQIPRIRKLASSLYLANDCDLVALTATWADKDVTEYNDIMTIVKGEKYKNVSNSGFLLYYNIFPPQLFAETVPENPRKYLPHIISTQMSPTQLKVYNKKKKTLPVEKLAGYGNTDTYYGSMNESKLKVLVKDIPAHSTKIAALLDYLVKHPKLKTLIICHRKNGWKFIVRALKETQTLLGLNNDHCLSSLYDATNADKNSLTKWNAKETGVMVADEKFYSTGVSFLNVREMILFNVPESTTSYLQIIGRSLRLCGHNNLPKNNRKLTYTMLVSTSSDGKSADEILTERIVEGLEKLQPIDTQMNKDAIDSDVYTSIGESWFSRVKDYIKGKIF